MFVLPLSQQRSSSQIKAAKTACNWLSDDVLPFMPPATFTHNCYAENFPLSSLSSVKCKKIQNKVCILPAVVRCRVTGCCCSDVLKHFQCRKSLPGSFCDLNFFLSVHSCTNKKLLSCWFFVSVWGWVTTYFMCLIKVLVLNSAQCWLSETNLFSCY